MKADAMATRISVLTRALPMRILLVDDDELELELMADRLGSAGFEVRQAMDGAQALSLLEQNWFPVIITDWQMPVLDGIAFSEAVRARGVQDTYIIMLTTREAGTDYERGYASGIDDYLTKKVPDAELFARVNAAFNTLALRRSLQEARDALDKSVPIDAESGVFASGELHTRLHGEICRAQRYGRPLSVITVGVRVADANAAGLTADLLRGVAVELGRVIRAHVDWIGRIGASDEIAFAVVLPEAGIVDGPTIKDRLVAAVSGFAQSRGIEASLTVGVAALERNGPNGPAVEAKVVLEVSEHCRRCNGRIGTEQLAAVKQSVAGHVAIPCRHGYAVASECPLRGPSENQMAPR